MKTFTLEAEPREVVGKKASKELRASGLIPAVLYGKEPELLPEDEEELRQKLSPGEKAVALLNEKKRNRAYTQASADKRKIVVTDLVINYDAVRKLIYSPEIFLVEIAIKGGRTVKAIVKEQQFHPVTDNLLHLDFLEVFDNKPIQMEVPVVLEGHAAGVRAGGKLSQSMRKLKVQGLAENIPERLVVNVDHLELGKVIKVGELKFDNIELISPKNTVVCIVKMTRAAQSAATAASK
jgi:large subunit ribosomal protein L25